MSQFHILEHASVNENFDLLRKAMQGDILIKLSQTTATPKTTPASAGIDYNIGIRIETAAGELHNWYNGKVLLAITDDNGSVATIDPAAGEISLVNGVGAVIVSLPTTAWAAGKVVTLTVSKPSTAKAPVLETVASATFVVTVAADS